MGVLVSSRVSSASLTLFACDVACRAGRLPLVTFPHRSKGHISADSCNTLLTGLATAAASVRVLRITRGNEWRAPRAQQSTGAAIWIMPLCFLSALLCVPSPTLADQEVTATCTP